MTRTSKNEHRLRLGQSECKRRVGLRADEEVQNKRPEYKVKSETYSKRLEKKESVKSLRKIVEHAFNHRDCRTCIYSDLTYLKPERGKIKGKKSCWVGCM